MEPKDNVWGAPIFVDGVCPPWLKDDATWQWTRCPALDVAMWEYGDGDFSYLISGSAFSRVTYVRLPADHFAYQCIAWNAAHPDQPPFFPWGGGDEAPGDWVGYGEGRWPNDGPKGTVLYRGYGAGHPEPRNGRWAHFGQTGSCLASSAGDIIGYRRATPASTPAPLDEAAQAAIALVGWLNGKEMHRTDDADLAAILLEARRIANLPSFPKAVDPDVAAVRALAEGFGVDLTDDGAKAIAEYFRGKAA